MAKRRNWEDDFEDEDIIDDIAREIAEEERLKNYHREDHIDPDVGDFHEGDPRLDKYYPKLDEVLEAFGDKSYNDSEVEDLGDVEERLKEGLVEIPREIGDKILDRFLRTIGLESRLSEVFSIAQTPQLQDPETFDSIMETLESLEQSRCNSFVNAVRGASEEIAQDRQNPKHKEHLATFLLAAKKGLGRYKPARIFKNLVGDASSDFILSKEGKVVGVSKQIEDLLRDSEEREITVETLGELPATRHLSRERFMAYACNNDSRKVFRDWIGENASADRVKFFDDLYQKYGYEGLLKLGKPFLKAIFGKCKGNKGLERKLKGQIAKVYENIPESNQSPPTWIYKLRQRVEEADPEQIARVIPQMVREELNEITEKGRENALRKKYSELVGRTKKATPVARGDYDTRDLIMTLDEALLDAMQAHEGKKTRMLEAMGRSLKRVNKTYRDSGLPAGAVVGLYDSDCNHKRILEIAEALEQEDRNVLGHLQDNSQLRTLFWLSRNGIRHEDVDYVASLGSQERTAVFDKIALAKEDARQYFSSLTPKQIAALRKVEQEVIEGVVSTVSPETIRDYVEMAKATKGRVNGVLSTKKTNVDFSRLRGHEDVFEMLPEDSWYTFGDSRAIGEMILDTPNEETAKKYCNALKSLSLYSKSKFGRDDKTISPLAEVLKKASETEVEIYGQIGDVHSKRPYSSMTERIKFEKLQGLVGKTAELVDSTPGLRDRLGSFCEHVKNYAGVEERLDNLDGLNGVAKATVAATREENLLLAYLGGRYGGFAFTDQNLQKVRRIEDLPEKVEHIKNIAEKLGSDEQLETLLDYASHNPSQVLAKVRENLPRRDIDEGFHAALVIAKDEELSRKAESVQEGYKPTFLKFAATLGEPERLKALPESHFYAAAQAYEFARQHGVSDDFFTGLNDSLRQGTVDKWANAIITHFREDAKGGEVYRKLSSGELRRQIA